MSELLSYGMILLDTLKSVGDWLTTPIVDLSKFDYGAINTDSPLLLQAFEVAAEKFGIASFTVLHLIIGAGITFALGFRLVKFFVGIITGS